MVALVSLVSGMKMITIHLGVVCSLTMEAQLPQQDNVGDPLELL